MTRRQKWALLASLLVCLFMGALDQTIVATATPTILADLGGFGLLSWLFTGYMLSSTVVVPLTGKLSDNFGRKPFLLAGILVFIGASMACGAAPNMESLIAFRVVQGLGGGMIFSSVFASIGDLFPPSERGKYIGLFTATFSLASILGPTLGGLLTDHVGWRWVFYINLPVGLVAIPAVLRNLPSVKGATRPKIDVLGAVLLSGASVSLLLALVWAGDRYAWLSAEILGLFAAAALLVAAFIAQERRHPDPVLPLHLFRNRIFVTSNLIVFAVGAGLFGSITYLPTFVQTALGESATASGIITTPQSLGALVSSILGGLAIARLGRYRWQTAGGALLMAGAMYLISTVGLDSPTWHISLFMVMSGLGFGLVLPTMGVVIQNAVPHQYLGVASSSNQFFRQIGAVLGIAVLGAVLANSYAASFDDHLPAEARAEIPPATLAAFDDPTLALDPRNFQRVRAEMLAVPGGEALLQSALLAQREGVRDANRHIFWVATGVALACFVVALFLAEIPLRREFAPPAPGAQPGPAGPPGPDPAPAATRPSAGGDA